MSTRSVLGRLALAVSLAAGALNVHAANEQYFPCRATALAPMPQVAPVSSVVLSITSSTSTPKAA